MLAILCNVGTDDPDVGAVGGVHSFLKPSVNYDATLTPPRLDVVHKLEVGCSVV